MGRLESFRQKANSMENALVPRRSFRRGAGYILFTLAISYYPITNLVDHASHQVSTDLQPTIEQQGNMLNQNVVNKLDGEARDLNDQFNAVSGNVDDIKHGWENVQRDLRKLGIGIDHTATTTTVPSAGVAEQSHHKP